MLTRELGIVEYRNGRVHPDRLTQKAHGHYRRHAEQMIQVYREGLGKTRHELHQQVRRVFDDEPNCPPRRVDAFCKLLDDQCEFDTDRHGESAVLRRKVFQGAAPFHPLVAAPDRLFEHEAWAVRQRIAADLGLAWEEIEFKLFADVIEFHRLKAFNSDIGPEELLSRYNVAQTQVALYGATRMTIRATADFKTIVRHAKLCRLLHRISRSSDGKTYIVELDGPASVSRETRRYGVNMASLLPVLLACKGWEMEAVIQTNRGGWKRRLTLSPKDGLRSHLTEPEAFDSSVEERFFRKWGPEPREGWSLVREGDILYQRQKVFIPDFTFRHEDGRQVHMEIVGFWTPAYLREKVETLRQFERHPILLAIQESSAERLPRISLPTVTYKSSIKLQDVLEKLQSPAEWTLVAAGRRD